MSKYYFIVFNYFEDLVRLEMLALNYYIQSVRESLLEFLRRTRDQRGFIMFQILFHQTMILTFFLAKSAAQSLKQLSRGYSSCMSGIMNETMSFLSFFAGALVFKLYLTKQIQKNSDRPSLHQLNSHFKIHDEIMRKAFFRILSRFMVIHG